MLPILKKTPLNGFLLILILFADEKIVPAKYEKSVPYANEKTFYVQPDTSGFLLIFFLYTRTNSNKFQIVLFLFHD